MSDPVLASIASILPKTQVTTETIKTAAKIPNLPSNTLLNWYKLLNENENYVLYQEIQRFSLITSQSSDLITALYIICAALASHCLHVKFIFQRLPKSSQSSVDVSLAHTLVQFIHNQDFEQFHNVLQDKQKHVQSFHPIIQFAIHKLYVHVVQLQLNSIETLYSCISMTSITRKMRLEESQVSKLIEAFGWDKDVLEGNTWIKPRALNVHISDTESPLEQLKQVTKFIQEME